MEIGKYPAVFTSHFVNNGYILDPPPPPPLKIDLYFFVTSMSVISNLFLYPTKPALLLSYIKTPLQPNCVVHIACFLGVTLKL